MTATATIKKYYGLSKPGIVYGNLISAVGGFALAAQRYAPGVFELPLLVETVIGVSLVIAGICALNNVVDRDVDAKMERTKNRAVVTGEISPRAATIYGTALALIGLKILLVYTNVFAFAVALAGSVFYVVLYAIGKRTSVHGTLVGAVAGAMPPLVGYCAVSNAFDGGAWILFAIMVAWQMPHFYAIGIFRLKDYADAGLPILPVKEGIRATKIQMLFYVIVFTVAGSLLTFFGYAGPITLSTALVLGIAWLIPAIKGLRLPPEDDVRWARKTFTFSLIAMTAFFAAIVADWLL